MTKNHREDGEFGDGATVRKILTDAFPGLAPHKPVEPPRVSDERLAELADFVDRTGAEEVWLCASAIAELQSLRASGGVMVKGETVAWAGKMVKLPDWDASHGERLSPENLQLAGTSLGEYAFGNLSMGYGVTVTVREVGRLIDAARAASPPIEPAGVTVTDRPTHRHRKRGTEYVLIGIGKMQTEYWSEWMPATQIGEVDWQEPIDMREVAIYRSYTDPSEIWVRPREEFEDGRFEALALGDAS